MHRLIVAACIAAGPAFAQSVAYFQTEGLRINLLQAECDLPAVKEFLSQVGPSRRAEVFYQSRLIKACFAVKDGAVILIDEDGDGGAIPLTAFKESKGV